MNEKQVRIGNALFDSGQIQFSITRAPDDKDTYKIKVSWPASLLTEGQIQIKDSGAKAIWTEPIQKSQINTQERSGQKESRADLATYETTLSIDVVKKLRLMPFINFCVFQDTKDTKIYLCSEELFVSVKGNDVKALPRSFAGKEAFVQINGQLVGREGIISLNDITEQIHFKARTASGAFLEILTGPQALEFRDVTEVAQGKGLRLQARGADPIVKKINRLPDGDWRVVLPIERPIIYVKGRGGIAFRQEFFVKDVVPDEKLRPVLKSKFDQYVYSSSVSLDGELAANTSLSSSGKDSQVSMDGGKSFVWRLENLEKGKWNSRSFTLKTENRDLTIANSVYRGHSSDFSFGMAIPLSQSEKPKTTLAGEWNFRQWLATRWALGVSGNHSLIMTETKTSASTLGARIYYRTSSGLWMRDPGFLAFIEGSMIQYKVGSATASTTYASLGAEWLYSIQKNSWLYFDWGIFDLKLGIASLSSKTKMKSYFGFNNEFRKMTGPTSYWSLSLGASMAGYETAGSTVNYSNFGTALGYGFGF
ncbi:MAG: hypothetical protein AB7H97_14050 [Pseudobdellovibrionaceae bacterium]